MKLCTGSNQRSWVLVLNGDCFFPAEDLKHGGNKVSSGINFIVWEYTSVVLENFTVIRLVALLGRIFETPRSKYGVFPKGKPCQESSRKAVQY